LSRPTAGGQWAQEKPPEPQPPGFDFFDTSTWAPAALGATPEAPAPTQLPTVGGAVRDRQTLSEDELVDLAHRDPIAFAKYNAQKDAEAADVFRTRQAELARKDAERAEAEHRDYLAAKQRADDLAARLEADAEALANEKPKAYMDSIGNAIGGVIGIVLGQLGAPATGGENMGLKILNAQIDRYTQAQREEYARKAGNLDRRANAIARLREAGYSDYQAATAFRLASLGRAREQLLTEMQNYDPRGTTARRIAGTVLETERQMAAAREGVRQRQLDEDLKIAKEAREQGEYALKVAKLRGAGTGAGTGLLSPAEIKAQYGLDVDRPMSMKDINARLDARRTKLSGDKTEQEITKGAEEARAAQTGYSINDPQTGNAYTNKDGKPFIIMDDTKRARVRDVLAAAANVRRMSDLVQALRKEKGGASKIRGSAEYQELVALASATDFETYKAFGLGAPSAGDRALAENARGGKDITSFIYDPSSGFETYAKNLEAKALTEMRGAGYQGAPVKLKSTLAIPKADVTPEERAFMDLKKKPAASVDAASEQATQILKPYYAKFDSLSEAERAAVAAEKQRLTANYKDITPGQLIGIEALGRKATGDGEEAKHARTQLETIKKEGETDAIRKAAEAALGGVFVNYGQPRMPDVVDPNAGATTNAPVNLSNFGGQ